MKKNKNSFSAKFSRNKPFNRNKNNHKPYVKKSFGNFKYYRNEFIRSNEVLVIDESGNNLGVLQRNEAIDMARAKDLDLVEVGPNTTPPVCKIIAWSKFIYGQKRKERENKKKKHKELKELRFGIFIADGDKLRLIKRALDFLSKGHNVRLTVIKKGRIKKEQIQDLMNELLTHFSEYSTIESVPSYDGRKMSITYKAEIIKLKSPKIKEDLENSTNGKDQNKDK
ncbi:translation initiation factor IF-3 [Candidatus Dojkabacteria bacterium]|nr:translation initiation factor IF-3 [Candidatus Dojkabacteria bacterium]